MRVFLTAFILGLMLVGVDARADDATASTTGAANSTDPHAAAFAKSDFPSANECAGCHPRVFWEWATSNHAYASISPMFHKFEQAINNFASGTIGTFCVRCHQQIGTQMGEPREQALWERSPIAREGITCVTCHRVKTQFGKVNGERTVTPGPLSDPMYNSGRGVEYSNVLANAEAFGIDLSGGNADKTPIHGPVIEFEQISQSQFCVSCHQVAVHPGIKLEVVWEQYRAAPAAKKDIPCQDCHMGAVPGEAKGYEKWPIAVVNGQVVGDPNQKHSNHLFFGPGYPIAHPGLFPFNPRAQRWSIEDWLKFDYRSNWGDPDWEAELAKSGRQVDFPDPWKNAQDRIDAAYVISLNLRLLEDKRQSRVEVMENAMRIDGPFFNGPLKANQELDLHYVVRNVDEGHNLPSGSLGAQPELWFNVVLINPNGERVWESGYVDSVGDVADIHSGDVQAGKVVFDQQLFNLQTKFLTTNLKGTDREMYLPINFDVDQLPHIRPPGVPTSVLNHPPFIRMEGRSLPPLAEREARYRIPAEALKVPGVYRIQSRMRSRAEPIYFMKFVGATTDMEQSINEWMVDLHPASATFTVQP